MHALASPHTHPRARTECVLPPSLRRCVAGSHNVVAVARIPCFRWINVLTQKILGRCVECGIPHSMAVISRRHVDVELASTGIITAKKVFFARLMQAPCKLLIYFGAFVRKPLTPLCITSSFLVPPPPQHTYMQVTLILFRVIVVFA